MFFFWRGEKWVRGQKSRINDAKQLNKIEMHIYTFIERRAIFIVFVVAPFVYQMI